MPQLPAVDRVDTAVPRPTHQEDRRVGTTAPFAGGDLETASEGRPVAGGHELGCGRLHVGAEGFHRPVDPRIQFLTEILRAGLTQFPGETPELVRARDRYIDHVTRYRGEHEEDSLRPPVDA